MLVMGPVNEQPGERQRLSLRIAKTGRGEGGCLHETRAWDGAKRSGCYGLCPEGP